MTTPRPAKYPISRRRLRTSSIATPAVQSAAAVSTGGLALVLLAAPAPVPGRSR
ncbi:hypothetical protein [Streptomyces sp. NPDC087294]|uniref:hypothetical protein n=1 Tax=Streptomyces sp. NPDC087294 TaxID=3365777 RepID=UPI00382AD1AB